MDATAREGGRGAGGRKKEERKFCEKRRGTHLTRESNTGYIRTLISMLTRACKRGPRHSTEDTTSLSKSLFRATHGEQQDQDKRPCPTQKADSSMRFACVPHLMHCGTRHLTKSFSHASQTCPAPPSLHSNVGRKASPMELDAILQVRREPAIVQSHTSNRKRGTSSATFIDRNSCKHTVRWR